MTAIVERSVHAVDRLRGRVEFERGTPTKTTWRSWAVYLHQRLEETIPGSNGSKGRGKEGGSERRKRAEEGLGEKKTSERRRGAVRTEDQHVIDAWDRTEIPISFRPALPTSYVNGCQGRFSEPALPKPKRPSLRSFVPAKNPVRLALSRYHQPPPPTHARHPTPFSPRARRGSPKGHRFQVNWPIPPSRLGGSFDTPVSSPTCCKAIDRGVFRTEVSLCSRIADWSAWYRGDGVQRDI